MTRIFVTIPWFLPAYRAGGPIQSVANLVREYEDAEFFIFCGDSDLNGELQPDIKREKWIPFNSHTNVWYAPAKGVIGSMFRQAVLVKPDLWYIVGVFDWRFNVIPMISRKGPRKILSTRGMLHPGALTQKKWKKKIFLNLLRLTGAHNRIGFHGTDDEEKRYIQALFGSRVAVSIAWNFPNALPFQPVVPKEPGILRMVTIALISQMKNIDAVLKALGMVKERVEYHIYGPLKDPVYWNHCKELISLLPENIAVKALGELSPGLVKDELGNSHIFILPSKSENFGHALYEAMSAGRPVITSDNTPWTNLESMQAGLNRNPAVVKDLAQAISFFAGMDQGQLNLWSRQAHEYALAKVNIADLKSQYAKMFDSCSNNGQGRGHYDPGGMVHKD